MIVSIVCLEQEKKELRHESFLDAFSDLPCASLMYVASLTLSSLRAHILSC